jgi:hypothetical protein
MGIMLNSRAHRSLRNIITLVVQTAAVHAYGPASKKFAIRHKKKKKKRRSKNFFLKDF